jgi:transcriptional regulator with XRE-family HTH domain
LGRAADITQGWLRDIETGRIKSPEVAVLRKIAKGLGVDLADLLRDGGVSKDPRTEKWIRKCATADTKAEAEKLERRLLAEAEGTGRAS